MIAKILVAVDGSEPGMRAADCALEIARRFAASVTIVNMLDSMEPYVATMEAASCLSRIVDLALETQSSILNNTRASFDAAGVTCTSRAESGPRVDTIVEVAKSEQSDLIVIGARGLGKIKRVMLGSTSEGVVHQAPCAVLVVH